MKRKLIKNSSYGFLVFIVFALLTYFFRPTSIISGVEEGEATVISIELKREYRISLKYPSRRYSDYYEIMFDNSKNKYKCYDDRDIKNFGIENIINKKAEYQAFIFSKYAVLRNVKIGEKFVVQTNDIGWFPFLLFLVILLSSIYWFVWGVYIMYFASDEKRKDILEE